MKSIVKSIASFIVNVVFYFFPTNPQKIVFMSYYGKQVSCNPRAIYEHLASQNHSFKIYWYAKKNVLLTSDVTIIKSKLLLLFHLSTAKYWIDNCRKESFLRPYKKGIIYIQTWHGTPLKKIEFDASKYLSKYYLVNAKKDSKATSYCIAYNTYSYNIFKYALGINNLILAGSPRNDFLIKNKDNLYISDCIKRSININDNKEIILYAPTFRDDKDSIYIFNQMVENFILDFDKRFNNRKYLLLRLHSNSKNWLENNINLKNKFVNVSEYEDIRELYIISDILVTDYSSTFFDFAILEKPIIFFWFDYQKYFKIERSMYFDLPACAPGPIAYDLESLMTLIEHIKANQDYMDQIRHFNKKYNDYEDGNASKRVVDLLLKKELM